MDCQRLQVPKVGQAPHGASPHSHCTDTEVGGTTWGGLPGAPTQVSAWGKGKGSLFPWVTPKRNPLSHCSVLVTEGLAGGAA